MTDRPGTTAIHVRDHALTATLELLAAPAFYGEATVNADHEATYPHPLSSGQALLWRCVGWLNGYDELPAIDDLRAGLDAENYAVVRGVLAAEGRAA